MFETSGSQDMEVVDLHFESLRDLQEEFGPYLCPEGFFLRNRSDLTTSDVLRFRLMLPGEFVLIEGVGVVVWVRSPEEATSALPFGVGVGFATLSDQGRELVERIVQSHLESGGKLFDMSRPSENDDPRGLPPDSVVADEPETTSALKFTVREDPAPESDDLVESGDAELRLPFEEGAKSDDEILELEADQPLSDPVRAISDDDGWDEVVADEHTEKTDFRGDQQHSGQAALAAGADDFVEIESEPVQNEEPPGTLEIELPDEIEPAGDSQDSREPEVQEFSSSGRRSPEKGRSGLVRILIGIVVLAAGAWAVFTQFPEYLPWGGASPDAVVAESDETQEERLPSEVVTPMTDEDLEAAVEAAVDAVTAPEPVTIPEHQPTEAPVVTDAASGPGNKILDIKAEEGGGGTVVLIRADGSIASRRIATSLLGNPPRILVRIGGIDTFYRPFEIPVGTAEVRRIRIGHHPETSPPSLWVVLDRTDSEIEIQGIQTNGNGVRVEVGR